eukprot:PhF_6_TR41331/c0_g1_i1/m.62660
MPRGCYPVIVCISRISLAYPITQDTDCTSPSLGGHSIYFAAKGDPSKALRTGYDCHIIPVSSQDKFKCCPSKYAEYYEIVHGNEEMVIPVGVLWMDPNKAPSDTRHTND